MDLIIKKQIKTNLKKQFYFQKSIVIETLPTEAMDLS